MRTLRWKAGFKLGDDDVDCRNRDFVDCFNSLIKAVGQKEHCQEMEDFIDRFRGEVEGALKKKPVDYDVGEEFGRRLFAALPLSTYSSNACRQCGLCDLARDKVSEHLDAPAACLFKQPSQPDDRSD